MYAIIENGGKQYKAVEGVYIEIDLLPDEVGKKKTFDKILLLSTDGSTEVGEPYLKGVSVDATIVSHFKAPKIIVFKYRAKQRYRVKTGHRQKYSRVIVDSIAFPGKSAAAKKSKVTPPSKKSVSAKETSPTAKKTATKPKAELKKAAPAKAVKSTAKAATKTAVASSAKKTTASKAKTTTKKTAVTKATTKTTKSKKSAASSTKKPKVNKTKITTKKTAATKATVAKKKTSAKKE